MNQQSFQQQQQQHNLPNIKIEDFEDSHNLSSAADGVAMTNITNSTNNATHLSQQRAEAQAQALRQPVQPGPAPAQQQQSFQQTLYQLNHDNSNNSNNNNVANLQPSNKRHAKKGQWQTPPVGQFFPSVAPGIANHNGTNGTDNRNGGTITATASQISAGDLSIPNSSDDYAKALQEAYRRGAEAAAAMNRGSAATATAATSGSLGQIMNGAKSNTAPTTSAALSSFTFTNSSNATRVNTTTQHNIDVANPLSNSNAIPLATANASTFGTTSASNSTTAVGSSGTPAVTATTTTMGVPSPLPFPSNANATTTITTPISGQQQQQQQHHQQQQLVHNNIQQHTNSTQSSLKRQEHQPHHHHQHHTIAPTPVIGNNTSNSSTTTMQSPEMSIGVGTLTSSSSIHKTIQSSTAATTTTASNNQPQKKSHHNDAENKTQRSISLPDMSTYAARANDDEAKRLKRLARNRASARLRRLRKKNLVESYEAEVGVLEASLTKLRAHQWGIGIDPDVLLEALSMDRGQQKIDSDKRKDLIISILTQQKEQVQNIMDCQLENMVLGWIARHGQEDGEIGGEDGGVDKQMTDGSGGDNVSNSEEDNLDVLANELNDLLQLTPEQKKQLQKATEGVDEERKAIEVVDSSLSALLSNPWLMNNGLEECMNQFTSVMNPTQMSKFMLWADHNAEAIDQLDYINAPAANSQPFSSPSFVFGIDDSPAGDDN